MKKFANACTRFVERFIPDAFLFAVILTVVCFVGALIFTESGAYATMMAWGKGIWGLLSFTAQICTAMVFGYALVKTPAVDKLLDAICRKVHSPAQAYFVAAAATAGLSWFSWSGGLICGGLIAVKLAQKVRGIHYPLLVAACYSGWVTFQCGPTAALLQPATPGTWSDKLYGVIPVSSTAFAPWNWTIFIIAGFIVIPIIMMRLAPSKSEKIIELNYSLDESAAAVEKAPKISLKGLPFNTWCENNYLFNLVFGIAVIIYLIYYFINGGGLTFDSFNLIFLAVGLLLTPTPIQYVKTCAEGVSTCGGIILQYPLYAGIQGIMVTTGLASVIADVFVALSSVRTLPWMAFISGGFINMFIPSGGGQWNVQGPIFLDAATKLGASLPMTTMGVLYGDAWTNMIQPFWALPLLGIANLKIKDIMGYCVITLILWFIIVTAVMLLWPI